MKNLVEHILKEDIVSFKEELKLEMKTRAIKRISEIKEKFQISEFSESVALEKLNELSLEKLNKYKKDAREYTSSVVNKIYSGNPVSAEEQSKYFKRSKNLHKIEDHIRNLENPITKPNVHDLTHMDDDGEVYDHTQTSDKIKDGDVMKLKGNRAAVMVKAWPVITHGDSDELHKTKEPNGINKMDRGRYKKSHELASSIVK